MSYPGPSPLSPALSSAPQLLSFSAPQPLQRKKRKKPITTTPAQHACTTCSSQNLPHALAIGSHCPRRGIKFLTRWEDTNFLFLVPQQTDTPPRKDLTWPPALVSQTFGSYAPPQQDDSTVTTPLPPLSSGTSPPRAVPSTISPVGVFAGLPSLATESPLRLVSRTCSPACLSS
jgi:hypothetical protein